MPIESLFRRSLFQFLPFVCVLLAWSFVPSVASTQETAQVEQRVEQREQDPVIVMNTSRYLEVERDGQTYKNAAAYDALDRPDLRNKYRARQVINPLLVVGSGALAFGSYALVAFGLFVSTSTDPQTETTGYVAAGLGGVGIIGAVALAVWAITRGLHPMSPQQRVRLESEYGKGK